MKKITQLLFGLLTCGIATAAAEPATVAEDTGHSQILRVTRTQADTVAVLQWTMNTERQFAARPDSPKSADLSRAVAEAQAAHAKKLEQLETLSRKLEELLAAVAAGEADKTNLSAQIAEWEQKLTDAKAELAALAKREAELTRRLTEDGQGNGVAAGVDAGDRKPVVVSINHDFVAPVAAPYFRGRRIRWSDGDTGVEISANQDGVPLGKALESGGWLAKALEDATPEKNYVAVLLASDSVTTYYALLKELRQHKLRHNWETWDGISFKIITHHLPGNSGGSSGGTVLY